MHYETDIPLGRFVVDTSFIDSGRLKVHGTLTYKNIARTTFDGVLRLRVQVKDPTGLSALLPGASQVWDVLKGMVSVAKEKRERAAAAGFGAVPGAKAKPRPRTKAKA
jgi:hypothetical protein